MDHPKTLIEFMELYATEEDCRQAIFEHRWPHGFSCRRCGHDRAWPLRGRGLYECANCHYQGSVTAGTIFHKTRTDLRKWFLAIWLLASTKKAPSAAELSRQLGVTVKTAWLVRRKIQHAMGRREGELLLRGIVELDEGFLGGRRSRPGEPRTPPAGQDDGRHLGRADAIWRFGPCAPARHRRRQRRQPDRRGACHDRQRQPRADRRLERLRRSCAGRLRSSPAHPRQRQ